MWQGKTCIGRSKALRAGGWVQVPASFPCSALLPIASLQLLARKMAGSSGARLAGLLVAVLLAAVHSQARELKGRNLLQCEVSSTAVAGSSR